MQDFTALIEATQQQLDQTRRQVIADAACGRGPQPWERDWPLGEFDLWEHLTSATFNPEPALMGHLVTMANWALMSPLGRQALIADGQATNPGQHTLDTLREFRSALVARRRELLSARLDEETASWMQHWPLGEFHLFEHITTCPEFKPDWFTTGELLEMADWALASDEARQIDWSDPLQRLSKQPVLDAIHQFGEGLGIRRHRLLTEQAQLSLRYSADQLENLRRCLGD